MNTLMKIYLAIINNQKHMKDINDEIDIIREMSKEPQEKLELMKLKLERSIKVQKDTLSMVIQPLPIAAILISVVPATFMNMFNIMSNIAIQTAKKSELEEAQNDLSRMVNQMIDFPIQLVLILIGCWLAIYAITRISLSIKYSTLDIIKKSIEKRTLRNN
ncbi:hypothetical protein [Sporolactobacillus terrae]|uniref:Uncharacterized protein n=1 Tax=Sporolactobacillus terrae TaxID=269673 RepID=A0A5K7WSQ7_9BACL|nr:hypothetical protein [Sporolactobacillus terrae]BBN97515.1 hypothetical protein St703_02200 [Sporolactobacillus terrae]